MGRGSYTASDWSKLRSSFGPEHSLAAPDRNAGRIFRSTKPSSSPASLVRIVREAFDNEDSPESTPVMIGFDVTASMGYLAGELATHSLNMAINYLLENKPISCPQIMCCAIGDCKSDKYPLQVTQFESDIRIIKQLISLCLEGGGGGNGGESYNLAWYFAARRTRTDCFRKRGKKGYLITIGDDDCHDRLTRAEIAKVFGDSVPYDISNEELVTEAGKMYNIFHICIDTGDPGCDRIFANWRELLPGRATVIDKRDISVLSELIYSLIAVSEGSTPNEALRTTDQTAAEKAARSLAYINIRQADNNVISF